MCACVCVSACEYVCMCCHHVWLAAIQVNNCNELNQIGWSTDRHRQNIASNEILTMKSCESLNPLQEETFEKPSDEQTVGKIRSMHAYHMCVVRLTTRTHTHNLPQLFLHSFSHILFYFSVDTQNM